MPVNSSTRAHLYGAGPSTATAFAPGKLIVTGEHSVLYGAPALALPLSRGITVNVSHSTHTHVLSPIADQRIVAALNSLFPNTPVKLTIESSLPIGAGLGSSAALGIAIIRAMAQLTQIPIGFDETYEKGLAFERFFHGTPSGLDHSVSALGKPLCFRKGPPPSFEQVPLRDLAFVLLPSGTTGNTREQVQKVAEKANTEPFKTLIKDMCSLSESIVEWFSNSENGSLSLKELGQQLNVNHNYLQRLGVSTPLLDHLVDASLRHGALGAKLTGSGGGGVVMALTPNPHDFCRAIRSVCPKAFIVITGGG